MYIFPCLTGVLFLFISELFVRPQTNPKLPPFLSELPCMLLGLCIVCLFIDLGYEPFLDITIANFSPFHTSFLFFLTVLHGEAFEFDVLTLVHFSFHFFCFRNYTQPSLPRLMYRKRVTLPF